MSHKLKPIKLNVPNLPAWEIYYCSICDEAWTSRFVKKLSTPLCPRKSHGNET